MRARAAMVTSMLAACSAPSAKPAALPDAHAVGTSSTASDRGRRRIELYPPQDLDALARADAEQLVRLADRARVLAADLDAHRALFTRSATGALGADDRELALDLFAQALAYQVALDALARFNLEFHRIDPIAHPLRHARHFLIGFTAYALQARVGLDFVQRTIGKPDFERLLDEGSPERGLPPAAYERLKWNVVHLEEVGRIFAARQYHELLARTAYPRLDPSFARLAEIATASFAAARRHLADSGARMFSANGLDLLADGGHHAWFPVQAGVAEVLGDTRVHRVHADLIGAAAIADAVARTQPGDIIVERRNWYLSNVGLPGFWPHTALYLGSPEELAAFLDGDAEVRAAYGGPFTAALAARAPAAWAAYQASDAGHPMRLIEAMSEGVVFTSAEHSLAADYAAALRPRLPKVEIARAVERAFGYRGRPYDFDFDFRTDRALVCSELVFKAYEPRRGVRGLRLDLARMVGRPTLPPNTMIAQYDREHGTAAQQLDFVWFLDGRERGRTAEWADEAALRASHRRLKWDIAQR